VVTAIGIILADVLLFVFFVIQYRQELGLTAGGSHDAPVVRKKPVVKKPPPPPAAGANPASRGRQLIVGPVTDGRQSL
jgi:hypothetical protein